MQLQTLWYRYISIIIFYTISQSKGPYFTITLLSYVGNN